MNTKINLTYQGEEYVLEYNRHAVKMLESRNFSVEDFMSKPIINIEMAFKGSFLKNHKNVSEAKIEEIYAACPNKTSLVSNITTMIQETYEALLEEPKEGDEGKASWEVVDLSPKKVNK